MWIISSCNRFVFSLYYVCFYGIICVFIVLYVFSLYYMCYHQHCNRQHCNHQHCYHHVLSPHFLLVWTYVMGIQKNLLKEMVEHQNIWLNKWVRTYSQFYEHFF